MSILQQTFLESKEIKRLICQRSTEYDMPILYICREVGIDYDEFMRSYINVKEKSIIEITDDSIIKILAILGIEVRLQFVINSTIDMAQKSADLSKKHQVKRK